MAVFVKVLTDVDVEKRSSFPDGCTPALPQFEERHALKLKVKDEAGNLWNFGCPIRPGVAPKPVIFSGWTQFVRSKELKKGDMVILYREDDRVTGAQYKIEVKRNSS